MKGLGRHTPKVWRAIGSLTQHRIAQRTGMSQTRYWQIENGAGAEPSDDERKAVADALGVRVSDIAWPEVGARAS